MSGAYSQDGAYVAYPSDADYSADGTGQYRAVQRTATGISLCTANDPDCIGILQDDPATGEAGTIKTRDVSKVVAGAAFTNRALLTSDANGRLVTATTGQNVIARALEAATASGQVVAAEIRLGGLAA